MLLISLTTHPNCQQPRQSNQTAVAHLSTLSTHQQSPLPLPHLSLVSALPSVLRSVHTQSEQSLVQSMIRLKKKLTVIGFSLIDCCSILCAPITPAVVPNSTYASQSSTKSPSPANVTYFTSPAYSCMCSSTSETVVVWGLMPRTWMVR